MVIFTSIFMGAVAGGLAALVCRPFNVQLATCLAVGILGSLLGLASDFWLSKGGLAHLTFSEYVASGVGAAISLFLWIVAQRLFFGNPPERVITD